MIERTDEKPKWTPEPWHVSAIGRDRFCRVRGADGLTICRDVLPRDAPLIAAAPDEDAALGLALEWWHSVSSHFQMKEPDWVPAARAARAKARGKA